MKKKSGISWSARVSLSLVAVTLAMFFLRSPLGGWADLFLYDSLFLFSPDYRQESDELDVVVVSIDERSFDELQMQWPWPRSLHGELVDRLREEGAAVVGFDLLFAEPSDEESDQRFADAIAKHGNVVLASNIEELFDQHVGFSDGYQVIEPLPIMSRVPGDVYTGVVSYKLDIDSFLRRTYTVQHGMPSFAQAVVDRAVRRFDKVIVPSDEEKAINFLGPSRTIQYIPYYQALDPELYLPAGFFKDKVVLVGFASATEADVGTSELDHFVVPFSRWEGGLMAGVEVHAHVVKNIWNNTFIRVVSLDRMLLASCGLAFLFGLLFLSLRPVWGTLIFLGVVSVIGVSAVYCFVEKHYYFSPIVVFLPIAFAYFVSPFAHYLSARKQRNFIRDAFSTYLAPSLVNTLIESPDSIKFDGERADATIMFLDIAGFTAFSEKLSPELLIELMNRNLGAFAEIILNNGGMIDKYIGDCIMAVWGVPLADDQHEVKSVAAVIQMQREMDSLLAREKAISGVSFSIRIGLNSGQVIAGNVGGGQQFNYTVLGDEVNLASRLEAVNKYYKTKVIISESTKSALGDDIFFRELDTIRVVGKQNAVSIFELLGPLADIDDQEKLFVQNYHRALLAYRSKKFKESMGLCEELLKVKSGDGPTEILKERCEKFISDPPPEDWDGVYQMDKK